LFALASVACGLSSNISQLVISRCVQGIGAAALVPGSLAIISASFDEKSRGQAIGTWSGFTAITTALGPVLGGWLIERASWRFIFFINVPIAALVIAISLRHVPETRSSSSKSIDWRGAAAATLSLAALIYGFIESEALSWRNPRVIGSLMIGAGALILFVFIEEREASPMVPLRLFKSPSFTGANLLTLLLYAALGAFFFLLPMNLIQIQGYSAAAAGAAAVPLILLMFFLSRWSGGLVARYGPTKPLVVGPMIAAVGFMLFAIPSVGGSYWKTFFPAFFVLGLGLSVSVAPLTTVVMSSVESDRAGTASGINNAVARVAGVLAVAILGVVMVRAFGYKLNDSLAHLNLAPDVASYFHSNAIKLGGVQVPSTLDPGTAEAMRSYIAQAFVFGFRLVISICAVLAMASAVTAWRMIPSGETQAVRST
jgi:EmrB/QacA subfamily drug resistance transporter